jgi:hypothetical protein
VHDVSEMLSPDDEDRNRFWNVGQLQRVYMATALHPREFQIIIIIIHRVNESTLGWEILSVFTRARVVSVP